MSNAETPEKRVVRKYRRRAARYDLSAKLYYLLGYPQRAHRRKAVEALELRRGSTVVEIGCGTGINFEFIQGAIGPEGRIVGVDLTDAMLARARERIESRDWGNVSLIQADAADFEFPAEVDAILSTYALTLTPRCGEVITRGAGALSPGGRWVVLDTKLPDGAPRWVRSLALSALQPFAVTEQWASERPWEAIRAAMDASLGDPSWTELFFGFAFVAAGRATAAT